MAVVTKTLKASGGDYSTITAWESGEQTNLVTDGDTHVLEAYAFEDDLGVGSFTLAGWTTDGTHFITIQGKSPIQMPWNSGGAYTVRSSRSSTSSFCFTISQNYTEVYDVQFYQDDGGTGARTLALGGTYLVMDRIFVCNDDCYIYSVLVSNPYSSSTQAVISNMIVLTNGGTGVRNIVSNNNAGMRLNNCLSAYTTTMTNAINYQKTDGTVHMRNCVAWGGSDDKDFDGLSTTEVQYCATDKTSGGTSVLTGGTGNVYGITDNWTDDSTGDFSWETFAALDDAGTDMSAYTTTDILGTTRTGTWDIGPFSPIPAQTVTGVIASVEADPIDPAGLETPVTVTGALAAAEATAIQNASLSGAQYVTAILAGAEAHVLDDVIVSLGPWTTQRTSDDSWADQTEQSDGWTDATPQTDSWAEQ